MVLAGKRDGLVNVVLKEIWTDEVVSSKFPSNTDFSGMHSTVLNIMWIGIVSNPSILFFHVTICSKTGFITEDNFLYRKLFEKRTYVVTYGRLPSAPRYIAFCTMS